MNFSQGSRLNVSTATNRISTGLEVSEDVYKMTRLICVGFVGSGLSLVGVVSNAVTCLVFARQRLRERMNFCIFCLAFVDLLLLALTLGYSLVTMFSDLALFGFGEEHYSRAVVYALSSIYSLRATSGCYNMVIAVERCVCVMFPLHAASLIRTRTMGLLLVTLPFLLQAGFLTLPLRFQLARIEIMGSIEWRLLPSKLFLENQFVFDLILYTVLSTTLPLLTFFVISAATLITVVKLNVSMKWRKQTSSSGKDSQRHQTALTKVLVVVSLVYIVTMLPFVGYIGSHLFVDQFSPFGLYASLYKTLSNFVNACPLINCSFNFFIYYSRSSRFKDDLRSLCSGPKKIKSQSFSRSSTVRSRI